MIISSDFPGGSIGDYVVDAHSVSLNLRPDTLSSVKQYFHFASTVEQPGHYAFSVLDIDDTRYALGWSEYAIHYSYDQKEWRHLPTQKIDGKLCWDFAYDKPQQTVYWAYHPPYPWTRHLELLQLIPQDQIITCASTVMSYPVHCLRIGSELASHKIWITATQHSGETMAAFFIEALIKRLLSENDSVVADLLSRCVFYMVPCANPEGKILGNLRTNSLGVDLNRQWHRPFAKDPCDDCPEVLGITRLMQRIGVDLYFDIHGDEEKTASICEPHIYTERHNDLFPMITSQEKDLLYRISQNCTYIDIEQGYPSNLFSEEDYWHLASHQIRKQFHCPSIILEMPFQHHRSSSKTPWTIEHSQSLGHQWIDAIKDFLC